MMKYNERFKLFYTGELSGTTVHYYLSAMDLCCSDISVAIDREQLWIAAHVTEKDKFRVRLNHVYIHVCPFCKASIGCEYRIPGKGVEFIEL